MKELANNFIRVRRKTKVDLSVFKAKKALTFSAAIDLLLRENRKVRVKSETPDDTQVAIGVK